jgi:hypothetical protein
MADFVADVVEGLGIFAPPHFRFLIFEWGGGEFGIGCGDGRGDVGGDGSVGVHGDDYRGSAAFMALSGDRMDRGGVAVIRGIARLGDSVAQVSAFQASGESRGRLPGPHGTRLPEVAAHSGRDQGRGTPDFRARPIAGR